MSKTDKAEKQDKPSRPMPVLVAYPAGAVHPTEPSFATIGTEFILDQSPVVRIDKWQAPGNEIWNLYSIQVLALNAHDSSEIQSEIPDVLCPYCVLKVRHTAMLCGWFRKPLVLSNSFAFSKLAHDKPQEALDP